MPVYITDLSKSPKENLIALVNNDNKTNIDISAISFENPIFTNEGTHVGITLASKPSSGFKGSVNVRYVRVDLAAIPEKVSVGPTQEPTMASWQAFVTDIFSKAMPSIQGVGYNTQTFIDNVAVTALTGQPDSYSLQDGVYNYCYKISVDPVNLAYYRSIGVIQTLTVLGSVKTYEYLIFDPVEADEGAGNVTVRVSEVGDHIKDTDGHVRIFAV
jgi:hypothetical protein